MVKFLDGLEEEGLVKRKIDPSDRRAKLISLTAKGRRVQEKIAKIHQDVENEIFKDLTPGERETLTILMPRVLTSILTYVHNHE